MLLLIISLADKPTLESLLKQSFALFPTFESTFQIIVRSGTYQFLICYVLCLVTQLCPTPCNSMDCSPPGFSVRGDSPGKNTGVGCHALLQGIFPTQGLNPGLLHCRPILYQLSYQGCLPVTVIVVKQSLFYFYPARIYLRN